MATSDDRGETLHTTTSSGLALEIAPYGPGDRARIFEIFSDVVERGDGWPHLPPLAIEQFDSTWEGGDREVVVARLSGRAVGAYYVKANFLGRGAHVANAGYIVDRSLRGMGIGSALIEDSLQRAPRLGFDAIQFNLVFSGNRARGLYERYGWIEIGRIPRAIDGTDALIYWKSLTD